MNNLKENQHHVIELEIKAAVDRFMKIFASGDANAIAATYSTNPVVGAPDGDLVRGQPQLVQFWQSILDGPGIVVESYDVVDIQPLGLDFASEITLFKANIGGQSMSGKYLVVWKREDGQWKLHLDVFNATPIA
jgi:ketosteroid isomerase-like protein